MFQNKTKITILGALAVTFLMNFPRLLHIPKRLTPPFRRFDPLVDNVRLLIRV